MGFPCRWTTAPTLPSRLGISRERPARGGFSAYLDELADRPERPGPYALEVERELLRRLGDPQLAYRTVHVAGTRGKGSTCALVSMALHAAGWRVGRTTSPHLLSPTERVWLLGRDVTETELEDVGLRVMRESQDLDASYFETLVATAFLAFAERRVEVAVVEVGLGGRLDATNVVSPAVTAVSRLGLDHVDRLGPARADVAREKAGIFKRGVRAVAAPGHEEAIAELVRVARDVGAPLRVLDDEDVRAAPRSALPGAAQRENSALAWAILEELDLATDGAVRVEREVAESAFLATRWPARLELREAVLVDGHAIDVLLDVSHDVAGVQELASHLDAVGPAAALVFTCLADKDLAGIACVLASHGATRCARLFVPELPARRARPSADVAAGLRAVGLEAEPRANVEEALRAAATSGGRRGERVRPLVAVFGSFLVAEGYLRSLAP